jgi:hypothetical protein
MKCLRTWTATVSTEDGSNRRFMERGNETSISVKEVEILD